MLVAWSRRSARRGQVRLPFADRAEAGRELGERLVSLELDRPIVLALPRGGVPVGLEVARRLGTADRPAPLEVLVTRKIGYPPQPELGVGAIAEGGEPVLDQGLLDRLGLSADDLAETVRGERAELARRVAAYRGDRPLPALRGRAVVVVDDGLATGGTARAALRAVRRRRPSRLVLAVPVAAVQAMHALSGGPPDGADDLVVVAAPSTFRAVGYWYRDFGQLTDANVVTLLAQATASP
ncbi:phosphoribosyltransferase [Actinomadura scrupuli]|uniref:phosphoribosyltransferase n=1 Tax=Actinomadura scrupuli TaxID=559629 RepID=UPI003D95F2F8